MKDKQGQDLAIGDQVIFASGTRHTSIGEITSMGKKMVVVKVPAPSYPSTFNRYPQDVLRLGGKPETEDTSSIPKDVAHTILHALRVANGAIAYNRLEDATKWVNSLSITWSKE